MNFTPEESAILVSNGFRCEEHSHGEGQYFWDGETSIEKYEPDHFNVNNPKREAGFETLAHAVEFAVSMRQPKSPHD